MKTKPNLLLLEKENYSNALIQKLKSFSNVTIENFNNQNSLVSLFWTAAQAKPFKESAAPMSCTLFSTTSRSLDLDPREREGQIPR